MNSDFLKIESIIIDVGLDHTIKFSIQIVYIKNFGAITFRRYFIEALLARRKQLVFSANKLLKLGFTCIFFAVKTFTP